MNQWIKLIALACASVSISGCLDIDQQITLAKNELTYKADLKLDAKIAAMSDKKGESFCDGMGTSKNDGITIEVKESAAGGNIICSITAKGKPEKFSGFSSNSKDKSEIVKITQIDKKTFKIESEIDFDAKNTSTAGMEGMLEAMLAGRNISWSVTAPKIIETNGKISEDKKAVSWSVPLSVAFKSPQKFYAIIQEDSSWLDAIISFFKDIFDSIIGFFSSSKPSSSTTPAVATEARPAETPATPKEDIKPTEQKTTNDEKSGNPDPQKSDITTPQVKGTNEVSQNQNPFTPSFDCTKASTGQERLICSDRELSKLDVELSAAYKAARQRASDSDAIKSDQREWVKSVQRSCSDKECLSNAYKTRINQLNK